MARKKKAGGRGGGAAAAAATSSPAGAAGPSSAEQPKPRGRGRPRKNPVVVAAAVPDQPDAVVKEEQSQSSSISTADEQSQDATTSQTGDESLPPASNSKKFGKFRILHSSSPSSSSGEQPSEWATKVEAEVPLPSSVVEEVVIETCTMEVEVTASEEIKHEEVDVEMAVAEETVVCMAEDDSSSSAAPPTNEATVAKEQEESSQQLKGEIENFEKLTIESEQKVDEEEEKILMIAAEEKKEKTEAKIPEPESPQNARRRSSRIKIIQESNVKVRPSKEDREREREAKEGTETGCSKETSEIFPTPTAPVSSSVKPVKVKSRWRRSSELEMGSNSLARSPGASPNPSPVPTAPKVHLPLTADEEKLRNFKKVEKNVYLTQRTTNKETKGMICECEPVDDDEMGCGEDCLNRMLMIECGPRCPLGDKCSNKRFQKMEYSPIQVFRTEKKGFGLQALANIEGGAFLSEYVGEVLDPYEFQRRAEDYANDKNRHYYFMALKSDAIIDATIKGNNSRFINHSCDPNAETQKWTVNGELRIGFFSIKDIAAGEEVTFDYQLQRYGKEAQRCYCEATNCRGWIGGDPDKEEKEETVSKKEVRAADKKDKKAKPKPKFYIVQELLEDQDLENDVQKLCNGGLKNQKNTLNFSRLMVRVENQEQRKRLLELLQSTDTPCRRLFLDYHGLRLMWSWMVDEGNILRLEIMQTLEALPITNITLLQDTKVLGVIEKWEEESRPREVEIEMELAPAEEEAKPEKEEVVKTEPMEECVPPEPVEDSAKVEEAPKDVEKAEEPMDVSPPEKQAESQEEKPPEENEKVEEVDVEKEKREALVAKAKSDAARLAAENEIAKRLLEAWRQLPEIFKIPKKVKKEQMKEHEREAEQSYQKYLENRGYKAEYSESSDRARDRYRGANTTSSLTTYPGFKRRDLKDENRKPRLERPEDKMFGGMSKFERRQLFAQRVEQEERAKREHMWMEQERERRRILQQQQQQPHILMDANGVPCFFNPATNSWHAFQGPPVAKSPAEPIVVQPQFDPSVWHQVHHIPIAPLPPKWKAAYNKQGLPYYFHIKHRVPQWEPPSLIPTIGSLTSSEESSSSSETESSDESGDEGDSESSEGEEGKKGDDESDQEEQSLAEEPEAEPCVPGEEGLKLKTGEGAEEGEEESKKVEPRRRSGLIKELIIISPRREEDIPTESSKIRIRKAKEQLRLEKRAALMKQHRLKEKSKEKQRTIKIKTPAAGGDVDAEAEKKIKEDFLAKMASTVVSTLNPYHKPECQQGRITSSEDFKHLARKLTNFVMLKELKHCRKVSDLACNDSVKHKAREYIKKYMAKFGELYSREREREHSRSQGAAGGEKHDDSVKEDEDM
ncbi:histone-lysine N-methyltransferase SETD2 [Neocloeon triangulifer]|uniref:histone-lysine N-methyltransferase SETD2 n=1 Tax=Neocloeon triangulifer TaxID=2078957 RepID=UPI00286F5C1E|nr:histone-lysine N-methyltransferase SETD2 [Neocloeon triangulifer]